jgi:serine/threonine protein kinase
VQTKLIDFNVAKKFINLEGQAKLMTTKTGSLKYRAPELLDANIATYSEGVDFWSVGACAYFMVTGRHAFDDHS